MLTVVKLGQLLGYLGRDGISEIVMGTGRPVTVKKGEAYQPLLATPLSAPALEELLRGTALAALIPDRDSNGSPQVVEVAGRSVRAQIARRGDALIVKLEEASPARPSQPMTAVQAASSARPSQPMAAVQAASPARPSQPMAAVQAASPARPSQPMAAQTVSPARPSQSMAAVQTTRAVEAGATASSVTFRAPTPASEAAPAKGGLDAPRVGELELGPQPTFSLAEPGPLSAAAAAVAPPPADESFELDLELGEEIELPPSGSKTPVAHAPSPPVAHAPSPAVPTAVAALPATVERAVPEALAKLVRAAREHGATDLHLSPGQPALMRTVGALCHLGPPLGAAEVDALVSGWLGPAERSALAARGYTDLALDLAAARGGAGRVRANVSRVRGGLKASFRLSWEGAPTLEALGLPRELAKVTSYHQGLVLVAGPSGHGKTTTLAALVDLVNASKPHHILCIEDPIEIVHAPKRAVVSQREVGNHTLSFASALRASLREDPDVIVIGEVRDRETVEIALTAAETGHLVIATISTPSAAKTIDRLIDMFPAAEQLQVRVSLAAALRFIVAQRLVPRQGGQGVVPAIELLTGVLPLAALIRDNKLFQLPNLQQRGRAFGMIRFDDSILELCRSGVIDEEVGLAFAENRREVMAALHPPEQPVVAAQPKAWDDARQRLGGLFRRDKERGGPGGAGPTGGGSPGAAG